MIPYLWNFVIILMIAGIIWLLALVALVILRLFAGKSRVSKFYNCALIWCTLSFLMPGYAKRHNLISNKWKRRLLVLVSPACLLTVVTPILFFFQLDLPTKCSLLGNDGEGLSRRMISMHTGVSFPKLKYVDAKHYDAFPDFSNVCSMQLVESATDDFIEELKKSDEWRQDSTNTQLFVYSDDDFSGNFMTWSENITVDVKTGVVTLSYMTL